MAKRQVITQLTVSGEVQYNKALTDVAKNMSVYRSEMNKVTAE